MTTNIFATQDWVEIQIPDVGLELVETIIISNDPAIVIIGLDDGYTHELVLENVVVSQNNVKMQIQFSRDGGSSYVTTSNYQFITQSHNANGEVKVAKNAITDCININSTLVNMGLGDGADGFFGTVTCGNPSNTTVYKKVYFEAAYVGETGSTTHLNGAGSLLDATSAYDALKFYLTAGNLLTGKIHHYRYL